MTAPPKPVNIANIPYGIIAIADDGKSIFYTALLDGPPTENDFWNVRKTLFESALQGTTPPIFVLQLATPEQLKTAKESYVHKAVKDKEKTSKAKVAKQKRRNLKK